MVKAKEQVVQALERVVAKAEAADYKVKYDVLVTGVKRVIRENRSTPIENWKDGHIE